MPLGVMLKSCAHRAFRRSGWGDIGRSVRGLARRWPRAIPVGFGDDRERRCDTIAGNNRMVEAGCVDDLTWRSRMVRCLTEHTALDAALAAAVRGSTTPILPMVVDALFEPEEAGCRSSLSQLVADGRDAGHALSRLVHGDLSGLFDGPSTVRFDPDRPMISLDLSRIQGSNQLIGLVMTCASAWMEAALADPDAGQRYVIYDEAWRLLRQPSLLARMQAQWKLSRALGIANLMVIHRLSDLDAVGDANSEARNLALGLLADCSTKIIYAQEAGEADKTGASLGLSSTEVAQLPDLARGEGLWRIGERAFVVRHICTPNELQLFDTNARMLA